jgi:hypothetical protein
MLGFGAFLIQVAVQGAWGIVPVHLNELSPALVRGMFPGFAYQLGNLIASRNGPIQAGIAESHGGNYGLALALVAGTTVVVLIFWTLIGPQRHEGELSDGHEPPMSVNALGLGLATLGFALGAVLFVFADQIDTSGEMYRALWVGAAALFLGGWAIDRKTPATTEASR